MYSPLRHFRPLSLLLGFAFLYAPILLLVIFSFNSSRLVTVWGGFSVKWYGELLRDEAMLRAAWMSIRVALLAATLAAVLGTAAGFALVRYGGRRSTGLLAGLLAIPLGLPDVILGLSLLLLFVAASVQRGFATITIAHATLGLSYVAVIVRSRLIAQDPSLEEAALDLGARPFRAFLTVTLPLILPGVISGWLLAFSLSLDDLVLASFTAGPGATTLPIRIYSQVRLGVTPEINALCTLLVLAVGVSVTLATLALSRNRGDSGETRGLAPDS